MSPHPERVALPLHTKVCKKCGRELPVTLEYFSKLTGSLGIPGFRGECKRCRQDYCNGRRAEGTVAKQALAAAPSSWRPRIVGGKDGPVGGYTEHPDDGYRFVCLPDSHGYLIDEKAAEAALAFVRYYRPVRIFLLGDHVDFAAISRFDKPASDIARIGEDIAACVKLLKAVRESAPDARITYLKGNHEFRFAKFLWKHQEVAALLKADGVDLPRLLKLSDVNIEWEESGSVMVTPALIVKHGHMVRARSGYTATGELERNGISGISGHTHRLGQIYRRNRTGMTTWIESGCLCKYDPDYADGQLMDWAQGLSFGTISLRGGGFSCHTAPIINGKVKAMTGDIGA